MFSYRPPIRAVWPALAVVLLLLLWACTVVVAARSTPAVPFVGTPVLDTATIYRQGALLTLKASFAARLNRDQRTALVLPESAIYDARRTPQFVSVTTAAGTAAQSCVVEGSLTMRIPVAAQWGCENETTAAKPQVADDGDDDDDDFVDEADEQVMSDRQRDFCDAAKRGGWVSRGSMAPPGRRMAAARRGATAELESVDAQERAAASALELLRKEIRVEETASARLTAQLLPAATPEDAETYVREHTLHSTRLAGLRDREVAEQQAHRLLVARSRQLQGLLNTLEETVVARQYNVWCRLPPHRKEATSLVPATLHVTIPSKEMVRWEPVYELRTSGGGDTSCLDAEDELYATAGGDEGKGHQAKPRQEDYDAKQCGTIDMHARIIRETSKGAWDSVVVRLSTGFMHNSTQPSEGLPPLSPIAVHVGPLPTAVQARTTLSMGLRMSSARSVLPSTFNAEESMKEQEPHRPPTAHAAFHGQTNVMTYEVPGTHMLYRDVLLPVELGIAVWIRSKLVAHPAASDLVFEQLQVGMPSRTAGTAAPASSNDAQLTSFLTSGTVHVYIDDEFRSVTSLPDLSVDRSADLDVGVRRGMSVRLVTVRDEESDETNFFGVATHRKLLRQFKVSAVAQGVSVGQRQVLLRVVVPSVSRTDVSVDVLPARGSLATIAGEQGLLQQVQRDEEAAAALQSNLLQDEKAKPSDEDRAQWAARRRQLTKALREHGFVEAMESMGGAEKILETVVRVGGSDAPPASREFGYVVRGPGNQDLRVG